MNLGRKAGFDGKREAPEAYPTGPCGRAGQACQAGEGWRVLASLIFLPSPCTRGEGLGVRGFALIQCLAAFPNR